MKYRHKIALLFTLVCTLIIGTFSVIIFILVGQHNELQFQNRLEERAILAGQVVLEKDELSSSEYEKIIEKQLRKLPSEFHFVLKLDKEGKIPLELLPEEFQNEEAFDGLNEHLDVNFTKVQKQQVAYLYYDDNEGKHMIVLTAKDRDGDEDLAFVKNSLVFLTLFTFIIIGFISLFFANKIIQPVKNITNQLQNISASNLNQRVDIRENQDQLYLLATNFNLLLDRLEHSFEDQKQFINNASHELRTPLSIILAETEVANQNKSLDIETKNSLEKIYFHANKLNQILTALLNLSFIEFNRNLALEKIRFDEAIQEEIDYFFKIHPNAKINLNYTSQPISKNYLECKANKVWLTIVLQNILTNAFKYSDGKPISIVLKDSSEFVEAIITDEGIGIEKNDLTSVGKPFYRAKNAQQKEGQGTGLSLSLKIMQAMNGKILISSEINKGTKVKLMLKK